MPNSHLFLMWRFADFLSFTSRKYPVNWIFCGFGLTSILKTSPWHKHFKRDESIIEIIISRSPILNSYCAKRTQSQQQLWITTCCSNTLGFVPLLSVWMPPAVNRHRQLQAASRLSTLNDKELLQGSPADSLETQIRHFKYSSLGCPSRPLIPISDRVISVKFKQWWHSTGESHPT